MGKKVLILFVVTLLVCGFVLSAAVHIGVFGSDEVEASPGNDTNTNAGTDTAPDTGEDSDTGTTPEVDSFFDPLDVSTFDPARHENLFEYSGVSLAAGEVVCDGNVYDTVTFASNSDRQFIQFYDPSESLFMVSWEATNMDMGSVTFEPGYIYHCYYKIDNGKYIRYNPTQVISEESGEVSGYSEFTLLDSAGNVVKFGSGLMVEETITATLYLGAGFSDEISDLFLGDYLYIYVVRVPAT
ncbi:MAG: hypothetical protein IJX39_00275 [Clostridia bacterium]|nr:hypothetical protein [Clostridia bacterium]